MKIRGDGSAFPVRLEFAKEQIRKRRVCELTGRRLEWILEEGTPILVGKEGGKKVVVGPSEVRSVDLVEATEAEKKILADYGFGWLVMG